MNGHYRDCAETFYIYIQKIRVVSIQQLVIAPKSSIIPPLPPINLSIQYTANFSCNYCFCSACTQIRTILVIDSDTKLFLHPKIDRITRGKNKKKTPSPSLQLTSKTPKTCSKLDEM